MEEQNNVTIQKKNALQELALRLQVSSEVLQQTLKATAFKDCVTNEQFISAVIVANTYGLNPILKEMYAFPSKGGAVIPIISIDGWISLVNRSPKYNGVELIENKCAKNDKATDPSGAGVESVTAKFYLKGIDHPVVVTEYMAECYNDAKEPWKKWPRRMLRHKAFVQGARVAFGFSGIYDEDEADRIKEAEYSVVQKDSIGGMIGFKKTSESKIIEPEKKEKQEPVAAPSLKDEIQKQAGESIPPEDSKRASYLASLEAAKGMMGDKYYDVLGENGFETAAQITDYPDFERILKQMREIVSKNKKSKV